jgi:acyl carrier protein phosphodiesterase
LNEIHRVLVPRGNSLVQMPNAFGVRCGYHQLRRRFREANGFEVRYWRPQQLIQAFKAIGSTAVSVDGFFSLNPQFSDRRFLPGKYQAVVWISEILRRISERVPFMANLADSLYLSSVRH